MRFRLLGRLNKKRSNVKGEPSAQIEALRESAAAAAAEMAAAEVEAIADEETGCVGVGRPAGRSRGVAVSPRSLNLPSNLKAAEPSDDADARAHDRRSDRAAETAASPGRCAEMILGMAETTDMRFSPSAWKEAERRGHRRVGCGCGITEAMIADAGLEVIDALGRCVTSSAASEEPATESDAPAADEPPSPTLLGITLSEAEADIEEVRQLKADLRHALDDGDDDVPMLIACLAAGPASTWRDGLNTSHLLHGGPCTARKVKYSARAVRKALAAVPPCEDPVGGLAGPVDTAPLAA